MPPTKRLSTGWLLALGFLLALGEDAPGQVTPRKDQHGDALPAGALARLGTVRWRHGSVTGFVAFLPDGKTVLSADGDEILHVWEYPSGRELRRFSLRAKEDGPLAGRGGPPSRTGLPVALSPDGKTVACNFDFRNLLLFDVASGKLLASLKQRGDFSQLAFSPDGKHLAVREAVGDLRIWDWAESRTVHAIKVDQQVNIGEPPVLG